MSAPEPVSFVMLGREMLAVDVHPPETTDPAEPTIFLNSPDTQIYEFNLTEARELAGILTAAADAAERYAK